MGGRVCIDSSVAARWVTPEVGHQSADALVSGWQGSAEIWAPDLLWVEVANALRHKVQDGLMTAEQAAQGLSLVLRTPISTLAGRLTVRRALGIALETGLTAWDATYIAAAERADATLWTADRELFTKGRKVFGRINLLLAESGKPE